MLPFHPTEMPLVTERRSTDPPRRPQVSGPYQPPAAAGEAAPPKLEGYQLLGPLGQGGMGTVWHAIQLSNGRDVAIKLLRGSLFASRDALQRFERESRILARLNHPHIARLYDNGRHGHVAYLVMELIDGRPLDDHARHHGWSAEQCLALFITICRAVDFAHERGVVHRDLKPSNVMITDEGEPRIMDFGLAKAVEDEAPDATITQDGGGVLGTPAYMAPERLAGETDTAGMRGDVYSLGVMLYELLTHHLPHDQDGPTLAYRRRIVEQPPTRPRVRDKAIPGEVEAIILKALSRDPAQRYARAGELADDLDRYCAGEPIRARRMTVAYVVRKRLWRHRWWAALTAAVLGVLVTAAGVSYMQVRAARDAAQQSAHARGVALYQSQLLNAVDAIEEGNREAALAHLADCPPELRRWEWYHLRHRADASTWRVPLSSGPEPSYGGRTLAISADGGVIYAMTRAGALTTWDAQTGEVLERGEAVTPAADRVALAGDGSCRFWIADGRAHLIDHATGELASWAIDTEESVLKVGAATRGGLLASEHADGRLRLWREGAPEPATTLALPADPVAWRLDPEGLTLAAVGEVLFYAAEGGAIADAPAARHAFERPVTGLHPGGPAHVLIRHTDGAASLVARDGGGVMRSFAKQAQAKAAVPWREGWIVGNHAGELVALQPGLDACVVPAHDVGIEHALAAPNGRWLITTEGAQLARWDHPCTTPAMARVPVPGSGDVVAVTLTEVAGREPKLVWVQSTGSHSELWSAGLVWGGATRHWAGPKMRWLPELAGDGGVAWGVGALGRAWRYRITDQQARVAEPDEGIRFSSADGRLSAKTDTQQDRSWIEDDRGEVVRELPFVGGLAGRFSPDGRSLLWVDASDRGRAWLVRVDGDEPPRAFDRPRMRFGLGMAFSPDGRRFAAGDHRGLWVGETRGAAPARQLPINEAPGFLALAMTRDGSRIAVGDGAGAVTIYDADTGDRWLQLLSRGGGRVRSLSFAQDDRYLVAGGDAIRVWSTRRPGDPAAGPTPTP